ncbi:MAG: response regulator transcription factor [Elusimicrobia bacterium]|nr:response regulator transcription factor [Elusimicrobiota bacterium]MDE2512304.1 response regulator transcription factor [Elusimicrobiota bacterium]
MPNEKILVVEDDKDLSRLLKYNLDKEGYRVLAALDGETGLGLFRKERPDMVLLDVMVPKLDGFGFLKAVRQDSKTPILMLTARKDEVDRVLGLELGADDYVTKPFSVREVLARVKAILRRVGDRGQAPTVSVLRVGELEVDVERYETRVKGKDVTLTSKEFEFLKCLLQAGGRAMSRDQLLEKIWGYDRSMEIDTRTIDQHIARLREKLGSEAGRIVTVKNVGYRLKLD